MMESAIKDRDLDRLEGTVTQADKLGLKEKSKEKDALQTYDKALKTIAEIKELIRAQAALQAAMETTDIVGIEKAIFDAKKAGVNVDTIKEAEELVADLKRQVQIVNNLVSASKSKNYQQLEAILKDDIPTIDLIENREDIALNVYIAMCYYKMDIYDVSLEILAIYLQSFPDSIIDIWCGEWKEKKNIDEKYCYECIDGQQRFQTIKNFIENTNNEIYIKIDKFKVFYSKKDSNKLLLPVSISFIVDINKSGLFKNFLPFGIKHVSVFAKGKAINACLFLSVNIY
jgi:hypothetical protein